MDWALMMGLGRGLESAGSSWSENLRRKQEENERRRIQDDAFNNLLAQMRLTQGLELSPTDEALQTLTPELRAEYERGRQTELVSPSGQRQRYYQPYSRTPEGMKERELSGQREQNRQALISAGLSEQEAESLAGAPPTAVYQALLATRIPRPDRQYDPSRGSVVDITAGTSTPVAGLPERADPSNVQYDPSRGAIIDLNTGRATVPSGLPERTSTTGVRTTEGQRKAAALLTQAEDAQRIVQEVTASGGVVPTMGEAVTGRLGFGAGNYLRRDEIRRLESAGLRLADAWLRYTSGAAVPETEVRRYAQGFMPQPGDDPQVLEDKANARRLIIQALREAVGQPGDVDTDIQAEVRETNPYRNP